MRLDIHLVYQEVRKSGKFLNRGGLEFPVLASKSECRNCRAMMAPAQEESFYQSLLQNE